MKPILPRAIIVVGTLLLVILAFDRLQPGGSALSRQFPDGLRIGYAVEAPYAFVDADGRVTGESPELARFVAARLGLSVTFVQTDFGALLDQLDEGRYDVVAAGVFITPERARRARFSMPTFQAAGAALVGRGNPKHLHSLADVTAARATVAVPATAVEEAQARRAGIEDEQLIVAPNAAVARRALEAGRADVLLLSAPAVHWMAAHDTTGVFEVAAPFNSGPADVDALARGAFAFRSRDAALADAWDRILADLIGSREHLALVEPFGFTRQSLPPTPSRSARTTP